MYLYPLKLRAFFFFLILQCFIDLKVFEKRCDKPKYFPKEGTVCHFLDQSLWD